MGESTYADRVREHARKEYVDPARHRRKATIRIVVGEVQKAVGLTNRVSLVCQALKSHKFLDENHLALEKWEGPPSGMSTTVAFTYRLLGETEKKPGVPDSPFVRLRGIAKEVFQSLGGGETFISKERERFERSGDAY
jgi:hypothetical protein